MIAVAPEALCGAGAECCFSADWAFASIARKDNTAQMVASRIIKIRTIQISVLAQLDFKVPASYFPPEKIHAHLSSSAISIANAPRSALYSRCAR